MKMLAQKIIVIHPGSLYLKIGRASDLNPVTILHAVARKRRTDSQKHQDTLLPVISKSKEVLTEFEESRLQVTHTLQGHHASQKQNGPKRLRAVTPIQQIATFNRRSVPEELSPEEEEDLKDAKADIKIEGDSKEGKNKVIFNNEILALNSSTAADYNIHFPMRRGELHLHDGIGGSLASVLTDMEEIWAYALATHLNVPVSSLKEYNAVLIVPDIYNRSHLRELVGLLLQRLKFRGCFLLQDSVAAQFGAGLGYACVVDIGDQKCSIACVEDGISQPDTRVRLGYGGGDIAQVFGLLLKKCGFPYKELNAEDNVSDAALLMKLKERFCHINLDVSGAQERTFEVSTKANKRLRYTIQVGDECVVAPLSLCHADLLNITGRNKTIRIQLTSAQQPDPEDCYDAEYLRETGRRYGRDQLEGCSTMPITGESAELDDTNDGDDVLVTDREIGSNTRSSEKLESIFTGPNGQIASLDQAIIRCIERCSSDDMKRKMYACILLVGGGAKFSGLAKWLEQQIALQIAANTNLQRLPDGGHVEVNVFIRDMDASMIAWKGAAIMSCLESAPELWIVRGEWEKCGVRILREKAPFIW